MSNVGPPDNLLIEVALMGKSHLAATGECSPWGSFLFISRFKRLFFITYLQYKGEI
jgi:hypothetical protein